ncbi:MAG: replication-associated recombination protein A [Methanoregula sp.]|jgi:putative ATPase|nr:replication-associated recombination protein A [Methanoregula sp.]
MEIDVNSYNRPLADRLRPQSLDTFVGQEKIIGVGKILRLAVEQDRVPSLIFWGPPGCGKTTLARIIANLTQAEFVQLSAVESGVKDIRRETENARQRLIQGKKTIVFIDEIHRFNKNQQDALLPHVERGIITLIGATTENPSFEVNAALLSRCRVFVMEKLTAEEITALIDRALLAQPEFKNIKIDGDAKKFLAEMADGDARVALNALELAAQTTSYIKKAVAEDALQKSLMYDKSGEEHYNIISALHKSMRGGDADAGLYWLTRMLIGGEDPLYIARRLIRFASEDIGIANSLALPQAIAAYQACHFIGMPECGVNLAQAVVYMAKSKKSNELYTAYQKAEADVKQYGTLPVPLHIRNAPTKLMKNLNYGKGYKYSPEYNYQEEQEYLPAKIKNHKYLVDI